MKLPEEKSRCGNINCINKTCKHNRFNVKQGIYVKSPCNNKDAIYSDFKVCKQCKEEKSLNEFSKTGRGRYNSKCKKCLNINVIMSQKKTEPRPFPKIDILLYNKFMKLLKPGSLHKEIRYC